MVLEGSPGHHHGAFALALAEAAAKASTFTTLAAAAFTFAAAELAVAAHCDSEFSKYFFISRSCESERESDTLLLKNYFYYRFLSYGLVKCGARVKNEEYARWCPEKRVQEKEKAYTNAAGREEKKKI